MKGSLQPGCSWHAGANCSAYWDASRIKVIQAEDVDSQKVRRDTLAMEWVDPASLAKVMDGSEGMKLICPQSLLLSEQAELAFMDLDHQSVLTTANRAVAGSQLGEVRIDLEADCAAMATAGVGFSLAIGHCGVG